jgi:hypothetical protein
MPALATFADEEPFFLADERRRGSMESDYGVWWRDELDATWRVSFVDATGEVYALRLGPPSITPMGRDLLMIAAGGTGPDGPLVTLATGLTYDETEARLDGWAEACGAANSLAWIKARLGYEGGPVR